MRGTGVGGRRAGVGLGFVSNTPSMCENSPTGFQEPPPQRPRELSGRGGGMRAVGRSGGRSRADNEKSLAMRSNQAIFFLSVQSSNFPHSLFSAGLVHDCSLLFDGMGPDYTKVSIL